MEQYRRLIYGLFIRVALLIGLSAAVGLGALLYAAQQQDEAAEREYARLVQNTLNDELSAIESMAYDNSYWDIAYENLVLNLDKAWADRNVGYYLADTYGIEMTLVLDKRGKELYRRSDEGMDQLLTHRQFTSTVELLQARAKQQPYTEMRASDFLAIEDTLYLVGLGVLVRDDDPIDITEPRTPYGYTILLRSVDLSDSGHIADFLGLTDITFKSTVNAELITSGNGLTLLSSIGAPLGQMHWQANLPGNQFLRHSVPWMLSALAVLLIFIILVYRRGQTVLAVINREEQERQRHRKLMETQADALKALVQSNILYIGDEDKALREVTRSTCNTLRASRASVWLLDPDSDRLICHNLYDWQSGHHVNPPSPLPLRGYEAYYDALRKHRAIAAKNSRSDPYIGLFTKGYLKRFSVTATLDAGLFQNNELIGVLSVERTNQQYDWPLEEISFTTSVTTLLALLFEIRERRQAEAELITAKQEAENANKAKSEFLANMSHELRTPLNAVIGFSDLIQKELFGPVGHESYKGYAADIHDSGTHLLNLISDILDISKIEAGSYKLEKTDIDLPEIIDSAFRMLTPRANSKQVSLEKQLAADKATLHADQRAILQILLNLLTNAIKFSPPGTTVTLSTYAENETTVAIAVQDQGEGIPEDQLAKIGAPFYQSESTIHKRHEGTGLGLYISKKLARLHGGRIEITSAVGKGTKVMVFLPCRDNSDEETTDSQADMVAAEDTTDYAI